MKQVNAFVAAIFATAIGLGTAAFAAEFAPKPTDVTVFKDGHALVMVRGKAILEDGWCATREVPEAILGTFWAFVNDEECRVDVAKAGTVETVEERVCQSIAEILGANIGKGVTITDVNGVVHTGVLQRPQSGNAGDAQPPFLMLESGNGGDAQLPFAMLETDAGFEFLPPGQIRNVTIQGKAINMTRSAAKTSPEISVRVVRDGAPVEGEREVGFVYLQKGVRWIPNYRVELREDGQAAIALQASIINELADLEDIELRLVVGVPNFIMKDVLSPMALRDTASDLGRFFAPPGSGRGSSFAFDNGLASNVAQIVIPGTAPGVVEGVDLPSDGQLEDLFLYHRAAFSLKKGERALVALFETMAPYEDIYTLKIPAVPPSGSIAEISSRRSSEITPQIWDLVEANQAPKVMHEARLTNTSAYPWTTGPATIFKGDGVLGQQLLTYTSLKNKVDVPITIATDVNAKSEVSELRRENDVTLNNDKYTNVFLHGKLTITNFKDKPVRLDVTRDVIGSANEATHNGTITLRDQLEVLNQQPEAWRWHMNPMSSVEWDLTLPAGESIVLECDWNMYLKD